MNASTSRPPREHPPIGRIVLAAGVIPALVTAVAAGMIAAWRDELPDPVATHWGLSGAADGFTSVSGTIVMTVGFGLGLSLLGLTLALISKVPVLVRACAAIGTGVASFVVALVAASTHGQRGLSDAAAAGAPGVWIVVAGVGAAVLAAVSWLLIPGWCVEPEPRAGEPGRALELGADERVSWTRSVRSATPAAVIMAGSVLLTAGLALALRDWWLLAVPAVLLVLVVAFASIRATIDASGITVRGLLGWPRTRIGLDAIAAATVVDVSALRDFGGWGYRIGVRKPFTGVRGWVLRSGQGLLIERADHSRDIVVVDDAETAAGLLTALLARARQAG